MNPPKYSSLKEAKSAENERAYARRRVREYNKRHGIITAEANQGELYRTVYAIRKPKPPERVVRMNEPRPIEPREWIDTPQDRAEVAAILKK